MLASKSITRRSALAGLALGAAGAGLAPMLAKASETEAPEQFDYDYDIVVVGAGGAGLIAALKASDEGASVLVIDANFDMGGHASVSSGYTHSGGGTSYQKASGVEDTPDLYYLDHTNPEPTDSRFNDRAIIREVADRMPECFEWMLTKGLKMSGEAFSLVKYYKDGGSGCDSIPRDGTCDPTGLIEVDSGVANQGTTNGIGVTRPFEETARAQGVDFMMNRHMDALITGEDGRVIGLRASYTPRYLPDGTQLAGLHADQDIQETRDEVTVRAEKAVIVATGGSMGNVAFRTMFDPRWTEEYGCNGEPYSFKDASGEICAMAVGAGLGATANQTTQDRVTICMETNVGARYLHVWKPECQIFPLVGAQGLRLTEYDGAIQVNMLGQRFFDESASSQGDKKKYDYFAAAMGSALLDEGTDHMRRVGGPIWAIFDQAYADEHDYVCEAPYVDEEGGYFFRADTIEELAGKIVNKYYEDYPMDPATLAETVAHYNEMVDAGEDSDFGKPAELMTKKIETGPFYAAWATPTLHDSLTGIRTNAHRQALTVTGEVIPGLYAAGECAGGHHTHGLGKVQTSGYIAALYASQE